MTDGSDVENRLSSKNDENSNRDSIQEEITEVEFNEAYSLPPQLYEKPAEDSNLEEINSNQTYTSSTNITNNPINYNINKKENNENNKDINSGNHFQINQNTINKNRKRNIIPEEKKKKMGRKKKGFSDNSTQTKYSEENQIKKIITNFTNFCYYHIKIYYKKNKIKKIIREFVINGNRDYNLKLLDSPIEEFLSKEISPKED